jgi:hypothetical protein
VSVDLKAVVERSARAATADALSVWAAEIWATPDARLTILAAAFRDVVSDAERTPAERDAARVLLAVIERALYGEVPSATLVHRAAAAIARIERE